MKSKAGKQTLRPTLNSERSPSVHYANWKETMLLKKQMCTLHRTERGLLHRITVDQKVIFRRFQVKLQRSKVANARLQGDRELEKELRHADMRSLHSESHLCHGGDDFLSKLERRPYDVDKEHKETLADQASAKKQTKIRQPSDVDVTEDDLTNLVRSVMKEETIPETRHNLRSLSALGQILQVSDNTTSVPNIANQGQSDRIKSAADVIESSYKINGLDGEDQTYDVEKNVDLMSCYKGTFGKNEATDRHIMAKDNNPSERRNYHRAHKKYTLPAVTNRSGHFPSNHESSSSKEDNLRPTAIDKEMAVSLSSMSNSSTAQDVSDNRGATDDKLLNFPNNYGQRLQVRSKQRSPSLSIETIPTPLPNNETNAQMANGLRKKKTSIFEENKKPDYRKQRLALAKAVDHSDLVRSFCDGLAAFGPSVPHFDYYASKMQADARSQVKTALINTAPGTPEDTYRKYTGDQTIKCITMPRLKLRKADDVDDNYNDYDNQAQFDCLVLDSIGRSLDAESESGQSV